MLLFYRYNMLGVLIRMCERHYWTMCGLLCVCTCENSGELWFSRPSEHVLPKRDQQRLAQAASAQATHVLSEQASVSPKREESRLSESLSLERDPSAWARSWAR